MPLRANQRFMGNSLKRYDKFEICRINCPFSLTVKSQRRMGNSLIEKIKFDVQQKTSCLVRQEDNYTRYKHAFTRVCFICLPPFSRRNIGDANHRHRMSANNGPVKLFAATYGRPGLGQAQSFHRAKMLARACSFYSCGTARGFHPTSPYAVG